MFRFQALIVFALVFLKMSFAEHQEVEKLARILLKLQSVLLFHDSMSLIMMIV